MEEKKVKENKKAKKAKKEMVLEEAEQGMEVIEEGMEEVDEESEEIDEREVEEESEEKKEKEEKLEEEEKPAKKEKKEKKEKKSKKGLVIFLVVLAVLIGGAFAAKVILTKTTVATETVKLSDDARGFSNYFKEYLLNRVKAEKLFSHSFRDLTNGEILDELTELKDGFSKVSRGVSGSYNKSEYKDVADVMESDSSTYLSAVRELRAIMTDGYDEEGDRQLAFIRRVEEMTPALRSALYLAEVAFDADVQGLSSKGVLIFEGEVLVEAGGGVMNILLGNFERGVTALSTDDMGETVKLIDAKGLFGWSGSRLVKLGDGLNTELEEGWVKDVKVGVKTNEAEVTKTRISLVMKNVWGMDEELKAQGIKGLVETEKKATEKQLDEFLSGLKGKR